MRTYWRPLKRGCRDWDELVMPLIREVSNVYVMSKEDRHWIRPAGAAISAGGALTGKSSPESCESKRRGPDGMNCSKGGAPSYSEGEGPACPMTG